MAVQQRSQGTGGFLVSVESIRGIAAFSVALCHVMGMTLLFDHGLPIFDQPSLRDGTLKLLDSAFNGQTAVIVFFVISGLVIGRSLDRKDSTRSAGRSYVLFLARRILRLYPAHIVAMLAIIGLAWLFLVGRAPIDFAPFSGIHPVHAEWFSAAVFNPLKWQSAVANLAMLSWSLNLVVWSLYVELCVAPLLPVFHRLAQTRNVKLDLAVIGALIAVTALAWDQLWSRYWFAFYLGMLVDTRGRPWAALLTRAFGRPWAALAACWLAMALPAGLSLQDRWAGTIVQALAAFGLLSLVVWRPMPRLRRVLEHPALRWNGRISYSFYLWHFFLFTLCVRWLYTGLSAEALRRYEILICLGTLAVTVALALGIAHLSFRYVEQPFVRLGRRVERLPFLLPSWRPRRPLRNPMPSSSAARP